MPECAGRQRGARAKQPASRGHITDVHMPLPRVSTRQKVWKLCLHACTPAVSFACQLPTLCFTADRAALRRARASRVRTSGYIAACVYGCAWHLVLARVLDRAGADGRKPRRKRRAHTVGEHNALPAHARTRTACPFRSADPRPPQWGWWACFSGPCINGFHWLPSFVSSPLCSRETAGNTNSTSTSTLTSIYTYIDYWNSYAAAQY